MSIDSVRWGRLFGPVSSFYCTQRANTSHGKKKGRTEEGRKKVFCFKIRIFRQILFYFRIIEHKVRKVYYVVFEFLRIESEGRVVYIVIFELFDQNCKFSCIATLPCLFICFSLLWSFSSIFYIFMFFLDLIYIIIKK